MPLREGSTLRVVLVPCGPLALERHEDQPALGYVVVIENRVLVGVGKVEVSRHADCECIVAWAVRLWM